MTDSLVEQFDEFRLDFEEFKDKWEERDIFSLFAKMADRVELLEEALRECSAVLAAFGRASDAHVSPAVWELHDVAGVLGRATLLLTPLAKNDPTG
jgi:hypothetical protein